MKTLENHWGNSVSVTLSRNFMIRSWCDAMENRRTIHWKPLGKQYFPARLSATLRPRTRIPSEFARLAKNPLKTLVKWRFCGPDGTHFTLRRDHSEAGTLCGVCPFRTLRNYPELPNASPSITKDYKKARISWPGFYETSDDHVIYKTVRLPNI